MGTQNDWTPWRKAASGEYIRGVCVLRFLELGNKRNVWMILIAPLFLPFKTNYNCPSGQFLALDMLCLPMQCFKYHGQHSNVGRIQTNPDFQLLLKKYVFSKSGPECLRGIICWKETCSDSPPSRTLPCSFTATLTRPASLINVTWQALPGVLLEIPGLRFQHCWKGNWPWEEKGGR